MSNLVKLVIFSGLLTLVAAEFPFDFVETSVNRDTTADETIYRLPEDVWPIHAIVEITPYLEEAPSADRQWSFDGKVIHTFEVKNENVNSVVLQDNVRSIGTYTLENVATGAAVTVAEHERIREYHLLKLNLPEGQTLQQGQQYRLTLEYIGNINETPLQRGVFRGKYIDDSGNTRWYIATHLQPVNARQAFPCWDEPGFKSTFDIIINRPESFTDTYSNMPLVEPRNPAVNGRVKEVFQTTPKMSAYLVTFHISEEFKVIADNNDSERPYRILARPTAEGQGDYALEVGPPLTKWLEEYLGVPYYTMEPNIKNDQIASPYWASGATENWGLVTYRELRLLFENGETNALDKMYIGTITAHELAHKWFGNYVTARWWNNVWINEGFASYFEYFAMDAVDKDMELEDQFNIMYMQSALSADSSTATRALEHTVNSPAQVTGHFSGISYSKGASLLLMLKYFISESRFKAALNNFLIARQYDYANPEHLYEAFDKAMTDAPTPALPGNTNITDFMRPWVLEPGYPVITVDIDHDTGLMKIKQQRFFVSATAQQTDQIWPIPLTYTTGSTPNWDNLTPTHVMTGEELEIQKAPGHEWVIFNVQQKGIYRVNYDDHNWEMLANALSTDHTVIHHLNKAQIVDDVFALMRSEKLSYKLGFQVLDFLKKDTSYYSWYPAITGFNWFRNRFLHLPDVLEEYDEALHEFLDAVITELGYDVVLGEPLTTTLNRFFVLTFACNVGHAGCIENAVAKFTAFKTSGTAVDPNIRRHVLCEGLRNGGYEEWEFLLGKWSESNNQAAELVYLRALGCTTNERARNEYLAMILDDNKVKAQDRVNAFSFLLMGDRSNAQTVLNFFKERTDDIRRAVVLQPWFDSVISNIASYLDEEGLQDMESWLQENPIPEAQIAQNSITSARLNMEWGTEKAHQIILAVRGSAASIIPTTLTIFLALLAIMLK